MFARPVILDNGQQRQANPGDIIGGGESFDTLATVGAGIILAKSFALGILTRTGPVGAYNDTTDTAQNIINTISGQAIAPNVPVNNNSQGNLVPGSTFRFTHVNTVGFAATLVAGAGVVLGVGVTINAASSWREYLVTVLNSSPTAIVQGNVTNGSAVVTGMVDGPSIGTRLLTPGMTIGGTGITAGTTILSVQPGIGFTMSANGTATNANVAITATPTVKIDGIRSGLI